MAYRVYFPDNLVPSPEDFDAEAIWAARPDVAAQDPDSPTYTGKRGGMKASVWWGMFGRHEGIAAAIKDNAIDNYRNLGAGASPVIEKLGNPKELLESKSDYDAKVAQSQGEVDQRQQGVMALAQQRQGAFPEGSTGAAYTPPSESNAGAANIVDVPKQAGLAAGPQRLFDQIYRGEIDPGSAEWKAMYQNGKATAQQKLAYQAWDKFTKSNEATPEYWKNREEGFPSQQQYIPQFNEAPSTTGGRTLTTGNTTPSGPQGLSPGAEALFMRIASGEINPGDEAWKSMYVDGKATPVMQDAYAAWDAFTKSPDAASFDWDARNNAYNTGVPIDFTGGEGDATAPGFVDSDININTGNPEYDQWINEIYLPILENAFNDDPTALLNSDFFKNIQKTVEETYGPQFKAMLDEATTMYERSKTGTEAERDKALGDLTKTLERGVEDYETGEARLAEDLRLGKERIARNLGEAQEESRAALANRGLTFGGVRKKEETRLTDVAAEQTGDIQRSADRSLSDITTGKSRLEEDIAGQTDYLTGTYDRSLADLLSGFERQKGDIEGERTIQEQAELNRLRNLASSNISNPNYY